MLAFKSSFLHKGKLISTYDMAGIGLLPQDTFRSGEKTWIEKTDLQQHSSQAPGDAQKWVFVEKKSFQVFETLLSLPYLYIVKNGSFFETTWKV